MSSSTTLPIRNESRLNGQTGQYLVATTNPSQSDNNGNQTTGRVIIAKAHPSTQNNSINNTSNQNNISGPVQFQFNSSDGTLYTGTNSFFQPQTSTGSSDGFSHHILSCTGGYFVPSLETGAQPLTHTTRASPATVQWLVDNFEPAEGCSLRRSTLYSFYLQHCSEQKLEAVNPASFGKLIRSVFLGLRTRRLGTRGNSKYHYYGIRVKQNSSLNAYSDEHGGLTFRGNNTFTNFKNRRWSTSNDGSSPENKPNLNDQSYSSQSDSTLSQTDSKQYHETNSLTINETIIFDSNISLPDGIIQDDLKRFETIYKDHCLKLYELITSLEFATVEQIWLNFWSQTRDETMSLALFHSICSLTNVQEFIRNVDYQLYQQLVDRLINDILSPMPPSATQSIRTFGKSVDGWLRSALINLPERLKTIKLTIINAFAMTLRRYTSLNHLAQAARAVLLNSTQVNQMLADLNKVDFHNVQEQAWWICECDDNVVHRIEREFKNHLSVQSSLEDWSTWLDLLLNDLLKPYSNSSNEKFTKQAKQILLNWSFYCSMVIRDLTLRSAASFGSFHLIRLLYDEYLFYLIEHKIAAHTQKTPIAVMAESTLQNKLSIYDGINNASNGLSSTISIERRNIPQKISLVVKKDTLSPAQIVTLSGSTVQLPIINKLVSAAKLNSQTSNNEKDSSTNDSVKRLKTNDEIVAV